MKIRDYSAFPQLRQQYDTLADIGEVINRGKTTVCHRLSGASSWKAKEKCLILDDLIRRGVETEKTPETFKKYFGEVTL